MQLSDFDEYPFHQHPTPFNIPFTSDVHFNDGYFCATFADDWYVVTGVRLHPNMNVIDGFAGMARQGECGVRTVHSAAVITDAHQGAPSLLDVDFDAGRPRVERVLHQLLHCAGRPFHHLAGGDAVDDGFGQLADGHRRQGSIRM